MPGLSWQEGCPEPAILDHRLDSLRGVQRHGHLAAAQAFAQMTTRTFKGIHGTACARLTREIDGQLI